MFAEDLAAFFDTTSGFAVAATLQGGAAGGVSVIFDEAFLNQLGMNATNPIALGMSSEFPAATTVGKTLQIGSTTYTIRAREPQDDGALVVLQLTNG